MLQAETRGGAGLDDRRSAESAGSWTTKATGTAGGVDASPKPSCRSAAVVARRVDECGAGTRERETQ